MHLSIHIFIAHLLSQQIHQEWHLVEWSSWVAWRHGLGCPRRCVCHVTWVSPLRWKILWRPGWLVPWEKSNPKARPGTGSASRTHQLGVPPYEDWRFEGLRVSPRASNYLQCEKGSLAGTFFWLVMNPYAVSFQYRDMYAFFGMYQQYDTIWCSMYVCAFKGHYLRSLDLGVKLFSLLQDELLVLCCWMWVWCSRIRFALWGPFSLSNLFILSDCHHLNGDAFVMSVCTGTYANHTSILGIF